jgi:hypothetical protein
MDGFPSSESEVLSAVMVLLAVQSDSEALEVLRDRPELWGAGAQSLLTTLAKFARSLGDEPTAAKIEMRRDLLSRARPQGDSDHSVAPETDSASRTLADLLSALSRIRARPDLPTSVEALTREIELIDVLLSHPDWSGLPVEQHADHLHDAGVAHLQRLRIGGDPADLDAAIQLLEDAASLTKDDSEWGPATLSDLGAAIRKRYERDSDPMDLERAIALLKRSVALGRPDDPHRASSMDRLADALRDRHVRYGEPADLDAAVELWRAALAATLPTAVEYPTRLTSIGIGLGERFGSVGTPGDLDEAMAYHMQALSITSPQSPDLAGRQGNVGTTLRLRYDRDGDPADLDAAIEHHVLALEATPRDSPHRANRLNGLGVALGERYDRVGNLTDLADAVRYATAALAATDAADRSFAPRASNLARLLRRRFDRDGDPTDLDAAVALGRRSMATTPPDSPASLLIGNNLATLLMTRFRLGGQQEDLDMAIDLWQRAVDNTVPGNPEYRGMQNNLGGGYYARYEIGRVLADLDKAIATWTTMLTGVNDNHSDVASWLANLGAALQLSCESGREADCSRAATMLRRACLIGLESRPEVTRATGAAWAQSAMDRASWQEAAEAAEFALRASRSLFRAQLIRGDKETWLRGMRGLPEMAAYALAKSGRPSEAVLALERGRATLLTEAMERDRVNLEQLSSLGHRALADSYISAAEAVHELDHGDSQRRDPDQDSAARRLARAGLDSAIDAIRRVSGYAGFLEEPGWDRVVRAAATAPLAYVVAEEPGGMALMVFADGRVEVKELPLLRTDEVARRTSAFLASLDAYRLDEPSWTAAFEELASWLWAAVMAGVVDGLGTARRIVLIPTGPLAMLPLHAARSEPIDTDTFSRALDLCEISFAPTAGSLLEARAITSSVRPETLLAVEEPLPVSGERLTASALEVGRISSSFQHRKVLRHQQATRAAVLKDLPGFAVLHFCCHGRANLHEPLSSGLLLAGDQHLTLRDLLRRRITNAHLVVLSACETAVPGVPLLDEVISLPSGFLQTGAGGIIGSLWRVPDLSTAVLMSQFYSLWLHNNEVLCHPAEALRRAQRWTRDSTRSLLAATFPEVDFFRIGSPDERPFASPYYWAAFTYTGG